MFIDISFVPNDLIPNDLAKLSKQKFEYPYIENNNLRNINEKGVPLRQKKAKLFLDREQYRKNYRDFEENFLKFSISLFNQKQYDLSKRCLEYLNEIGSKLVGVKEYLLKIYKKEHDLKNLKRVISKIDRELSIESDFNRQFKKLKALKDKYYIYN